MKKRLLGCGVVLVLGAGVILTGCQNATTKNSKPVKDKRANEKTAWQIGVIATKSGENAEAGLATIDGIKLAIDEINASGGINGCEVKYLAMDDEGNEIKAVNSFNTLKDWGMDFIIGTSCAQTTDAVAANADESQIFMLATTSLDDEIISGHQSLYSVYLSEQDLGVEIADYVKDLGTNTAVFVERYNFDKGFICKSYKDEATENGVTVSLDKRFNDDCEYSEIYEAVERCRDKNVDIIFMPVTKEHGRLIFQAAKELEYNPAFIGMDDIGNLLEEDVEREITANCVYAVTEENPGNLYEATFAKAFRDTYDREAVDGADAGYDSIYILKGAIEKANLTPDGVNDDTYTAIKNAMSTITYTGLIGLQTVWNENGIAKKVLYSRPYFNTNQ